MSGGVDGGKGDLSGEDPVISRVVSSEEGSPHNSAHEVSFGVSGHETSSDRGGIVAARGTGDGLVLRLDGRVDRVGLRSAIDDFMTSRRAFLSGQEVILEWAGQMPDASFVSSLMGTLADNYNVTVKASRVLERTRNVRIDGLDSVGSGLDDCGVASSSAPRKGINKSTFSEGESGVLSDRPTSLFDGVHAMNRAADSEAPGAMAKQSAATDPLLWDDPDARILITTLRSGQKVESEHSIVIIGDVNSGAEIIAGGDVIVLGTLRGVAHAGAYDETGGGRIIFALNLQPTQLRIGMVISRGAGEGGGARNQAEVARVDGTMIVVEPFSSKGIGWRKAGR